MPSKLFEAVRATATKHKIESLGGYKVLCAYIQSNAHYGSITLTPDLELWEQITPSALRQLEHDGFSITAWNKGGTPRGYTNLDVIAKVQISWI